MIEPTLNTPFVSFNPNREMWMEGKALPEDSKRFFDPLIDWVKEKLEINSSHVNVNLKLEYFNTSSSKQIYELLLAIRQKANFNVTINWFYEEGDDDLLDSGKHYESLIEVPFNHIEYPDESPIAN